MKNPLLQKIAPHALAIGIFLVISCVYCMPALKGLVVNQYDLQGAIGTKQQSVEFREQHGHFPLWTNSVFSGMPGYQIAIESKYNVTLYWFHYLFTFFLPSPASLFFLCCICFYILCVTFRLRTWVAIFGALSYAFASYNAILVSTGHVTKLAAMGYAPAVIAGLVLLTQRKYFLGFGTTLLFSTLMANQNHIQIVYYLFLTIACMGIAFAINAIKAKQVKHLLISGSLAIVAIGIGLISFAVILLPMNEYARETMRGGRSELTIGQTKENKTKGGLDKDYAFNWSYGIGETMTMILPQYKGGSSSMAELGEENQSVEAMQEAQLPAQAINYFYNFLSPYWGEQPNTGGPIYFGVAICLLFIAGLFVVTSWHRGWLIAASLMGIVLAWGSNLASVNYFIFDHLPYYNKFRAPSMALVIPQLTFAILACLALQEIFYGNWDKQVLAKKLKRAAVVAGIVLAILIGNYFAADYKSTKDTKVKQTISGALTQMMGQGKPASDQMTQQANTVSASITRALERDRQSLYGKDLVRAIIFMILVGGIIWMGAGRKLKAQYALIGLVIINFIDLIQVDRRYLKEENYVMKDEFDQKFIPTPADLQIKQDTGYFRVFDESGNEGPFNDSRASYFHNSVNGYHPAKLALYQDIIENQLGKYNMRVFNMLNTKYFISRNPADGKPMAQLNPEALGAAWLVKGIRYVNNANEEMKALDSFPPRDTVIVDKREQSRIPFPPQFDSTALIRLIKNENDVINYEFKAASNQFAVFSEIYYPYGWKAFIDGKEAPIARVNYVLRGMAVPAGNHSIEFRFEPASYQRANTISLLVGVLSFLLLGFCGWMIYRNYNKEPGVIT